MSDVPTISEFLAANGFTVEAYEAREEATRVKVREIFDAAAKSGQTVFEVVKPDQPKG